MVITSFLGLPMTCMMLKFSYTRWAQVLSHLLGGFEGAGLIHRFCAALTFTYFGLHLWDLYRQHRGSGKTWRQSIFGPGSMVLNRADGREFGAPLKWFFGKGPRPEYGRWTYWTVVFTGGEPLEKFKLDRPREYRELLERGELEKHLIPAPPPVVVAFWRRFGFTALTIGLVMILLILCAAIFVYK
jgi:hypothetical protein